MNFEPFQINTLTYASIASINTDDYRSKLFKGALVSYANIRLRMKNVMELKNQSGDVVLDWDAPCATLSIITEDWLVGILRLLKLECDCPERAAAYFYHRLYANVMSKRALAVLEMADDTKPEEYDELVRLVFCELPFLYQNLKDKNPA